MANQGHPIFLEDWLYQNSGIGDTISSRKSSSISAQAIIQAWTDLRDSLQSQSFEPHHLQSLKILCGSQNVLYVADPQAKLLLSILSLPNVSLPPESYPLFLRLLYIWVRKSSKQSLIMIDSTVEVLSDIFSEKFYINKSSIFFSEGVLLLGAISFVPSASEKSKTFCLELLCKLVEQEYQMIGVLEGVLPNVLGGIGYALSSSVNAYFVSILDFFFEIWEKQDGPSVSVPYGLMILHMVEWVLSNCINLHSTDKADLFRRVMLVNRKPSYSSFALVMAAAGVLKVLNRSGSNDFMPLKVSAEELIGTVATDLVARTEGVNASGTELRDSVLLQCISLGAARSGSISYSASLLLCLALALLGEIFPLVRMYQKMLDLSVGSFKGLLVNEVKEHLASTSFREAGAITGAFCNQYVSADEETKNSIENLIWEHCQEIYLQHQHVAFVYQGVKSGLLGDLEKIAESAFLMVVLFALAVTKYRLGPNSSQHTRLTLSVRILVSFSCMEYFRRMRLPEYMDTIRAAVVSVQENESACVSFVKSMPSYSDLTSKHGFSNLQKMEYLWSNDDVQTARILFYLRVIPTCIEHLPTSLFRKVVAPTMFLYMGHQNGKVARASHSMFVAFISSGKDPNQEERASLKEQLVFYYMQRSLEGYPAITPFEGMASGVAAIARHLPAGSPSIFYCIHGLVEKASSMCGAVNSEDTELQKIREGEWELCQKMVELLLRLLSLVDIQVLPTLMKLLAQLIVRLPKDEQNVVLDELFQHVAESDDVTRKPTLVSWLQSLSYLCSQDTGERGTDIKSAENAAPLNMATLNLNGISSRL
ncbi:unnamed protein product [Coffea canephora]|uniref:Uncharacterized protein n=1 Tax=Coffea canephora TaxID=49390 RepID=A0A068TSP7_COFCA|nr:unnamed protein product [Coffea canephora]